VHSLPSQPAARVSRCTSAPAPSSARTHLRPAAPTHVDDLVHPEVTLGRRCRPDQVRLVRLPSATTSNARQPRRRGLTVGAWAGLTILTCMLSLSTSEKMATVRMPRRLAVRMMRHAISPRLAIKILVKRGLRATPAETGAGASAGDPAGKAVEGGEVAAGQVHSVSNQPIRSGIPKCVTTHWPFPSPTRTQAGAPPPASEMSWHEPMRVRSVGRLRW